MTKIRTNIAANFIGRAWGVVSVYLFIPLYLKFLGIEAYGLVGFYSTLLGVVAFADMGLSATLNREMARLSALDGTAGKMRDLLRTYESIYLFVSLVIAAAIWISAPFIAGRWLRAETLMPSEISAAIRLMGIAIAFQLPAGLFGGGLLGLQRQVLTNSLQIAWGLFRGVGAVMVLWLVSPTIFAFAFWQMFSNIAYCLIVRTALWRALPRAAGARARFDCGLVRETWRYASSMAGMSVLGIILIQSDKLIVSKMLPLEILGYYTLAGSIAMIPLMLSGPIAQAVAPRLTGLLAVGDGAGLVRLYHRTCRLVALAIIPAGLICAFFAGELLFAWTGSEVTASRAGLTASLLLVGQLMQALTSMPYLVAIAHGRPRLLLQVGIASVIFITPLLFFLIMRYGMVGGGISWLVMNCVTLPPYMYLLHRRFLPGELRTWCLRDVGLPLLAALPAVLLARWLAPDLSSRLAIAGALALVWVVSAAAAAVSIPELRQPFVGIIKKMSGAAYA